MTVRTLFRTAELQNEFGTVKIEVWPEGLVLWVGGEIRWRSWRDIALWSARTLPQPRRDGAEAVLVEA